MDFTLFEAEKFIDSFIKSGDEYFTRVIHDIQKYSHKYMFDIDKFILHLRDTNDIESFTILANTYNDDTGRQCLWYMDNILEGVIRNHNKVPDLLARLCKFFDDRPIDFLVRSKSIHEQIIINGINILSKCYDMSKYFDLCLLQEAFDRNNAKLIKLISTHGHKREHDFSCRCVRIADLDFPKDAFDMAMKMNMKFDDIRFSNYNDTHEHSDTINHILHNGLNLVENLRILRDNIKNGKEDVLNFVLNEMIPDKDKTSDKDEISNKDVVLDHAFKCLIRYPRKNYTMKFLKNDQMKNHFRVDNVCDMYLYYDWRDDVLPVIIEILTLDLPRGVLNELLIASAYNSTDCDMTDVVKYLIKKKVDASYKIYKAFRIFLSHKRTDMCDMLIKYYPCILNDINRIAYTYAGKYHNEIDIDDANTYKKYGAIYFLVSLGACPNLEKLIVSLLERMADSDDEYDINWRVNSLRYLIKVSFMFNNPCDRNLLIKAGDKNDEHGLYKTWDSNKEEYLTTKCIRSPIKH